LEGERERVGPTPPTPCLAAVVQVKVQKVKEVKMRGWRGGSPSWSRKSISHFSGGQCVGVVSLSAQK